MHRTPKNIFVLNLAISGISTSIICIPPTLIQCLYGGKWYLGLVACKLVPTIQGTNILVSSGTITSIAIDRWISITKVTNGFPTKLTHTKVILINLLIWTLAFLIASPVLVFQTIDTISLPWSSFSMCVEVWPAQWIHDTRGVVTPGVNCFSRGAEVKVRSDCFSWTGKTDQIKYTCMLGHK